MCVREIGRIYDELNSSPACGYFIFVNFVISSHCDVATKANFEAITNIFKSWNSGEREGESPSQFEALSTMDESRNSVEMRWWTAFEFRSKIEIFETVVKWDDEPPSNFRVKSKFSKRCRNTTANRLRKSRRKRMYYKFRNRGAFRCRIAVEMRNCEISCEIFPTGWSSKATGRP